MNCSYIKRLDGTETELLFRFPRHPNNRGVTVIIMTIIAYTSISFFESLLKQLKKTSEKCFNKTNCYHLFDD